LQPQEPEDPAVESRLGRLTIAKQFAGDLVGTSSGQMLSADTAVNGSAASVAPEFVLQHSETLRRGTPRLRITVVPDSGTDELVGLAGERKIAVAAGQHTYDFTYTLD
jgi:hypothetical protein